MDTAPFRLISSSICHREQTTKGPLVLQQQPPLSLLVLCSWQSPGSELTEQEETLMRTEEIETETARQTGRQTDRLKVGESEMPSIIGNALSYCFAGRWNHSQYNIPPTRNHNKMGSN